MRSTVRTTWIAISEWTSDSAPTRNGSSTSSRRSRRRHARRSSRAWSCASMSASPRDADGKKDEARAASLGRGDRTGDEGDPMSVLNDLNDGHKERAFSLRALSREPGAAPVSSPLPIVDPGTTSDANASAGSFDLGGVDEELEQQWRRGNDARNLRRHAAREPPPPLRRALRPSIRRGTARAPRARVARVRRGAGPRPPARGSDPPGPPGAPPPSRRPSTWRAP